MRAVANVLLLTFWTSNKKKTRKRRENKIVANTRTETRTQIRRSFPEFLSCLHSSSLSLKEKCVRKKNTHTLECFFFSFFFFLFYDRNFFLLPNQKPISGLFNTKPKSKWMLFPQSYYFTCNFFLLPLQNPYWVRRSYYFISSCYHATYIYDTIFWFKFMFAYTHTHCVCCCRFWPPVDLAPLLYADGKCLEGCGEITVAPKNRLWKFEWVVNCDDGKIVSTFIHLMFRLNGKTEEYQIQSMTKHLIVDYFVRPLSPEHHE